MNAPGQSRPGGVRQGRIRLHMSTNPYPHKMALNTPPSPVSVGVSSREDEEVNPLSFQGTAVMRLTTPEVEEILPVQPRRVFFFPPSIPRILQAAVRDLDVTNRGVIGVAWSRRAS